MKSLVIIPARGGSKGIPHKNIKPLAGKPLIYYTIDVARAIFPDEDICVSTDDSEIIQVVEDYGLKVPFVRPNYLATDNAGANGVILHALDFFENQGRTIDIIVLLQTTSPFRRIEDVIEAVELYDDTVDMVTSVMPAKCNPYYDCFEDNANGWLTISKGKGTIERRQDAPKVWQLNGAVYVINPKRLKEKGLAHFDRIRKYPMDEMHSIDLDNMLDWKIAELVIKEGLLR